MSLTEVLIVAFFVSISVGILTTVVLKNVYKPEQIKKPEYASIPMDAPSYVEMYAATPDQLVRSTEGLPVPQGRTLRLDISSDGKVWLPVTSELFNTRFRMVLIKRGEEGFKPVRLDFTEEGQPDLPPSYGNKEVPVVGSWAKSQHRRVGHILELIHDDKRNHLTVVEWMSPKELRKLAEDIIEGRYPK